VISDFRLEMKAAAAGMQFEKAELLRKKIEHLENYQARSVIVNKHI
jgi:excinuclease ABC subunit C